MTQPHTLPPDWQPTPGDINYAKSKFMCEAQIMEEAESFKRYFVNGPGCKTKWKLWSTGNGAWGTWIQKANLWPSWKAEKAEAEAERERKLNESDQMVLGMNQAAERLNKPKLRPKPQRNFPARKLRPGEAQEIIDRMSAEAAAERRPKSKVKATPIPEEVRARAWQRMREQGLPVPGE